MQTQISVFQFQVAQSVRVEIKNGEPWFCLKDVAEILDIQVASPERFNLKENGVEKIRLVSGGQNRELTFINEPNLYRVIFRSNKPEAVKFQDWIFEEVIPAIRQTGRYELQTGYLNEWEREQIRAAVKERCDRTGETRQAVYRKLHAFMNRPSYELICQADFQTALNFLASMENAPELFRQPAVAGLTEQQAADIAALAAQHSQRQMLMLEHLRPILRQLQSPYTAQTEQLISQGGRHVRSLMAIVFDSPHARSPAVGRITCTML